MKFIFDTDKIEKFEANGDTFIYLIFIFKIDKYYKLKENL